MLFLILWNAWPHLSKTVLSTCMKLCLSTRKKPTWSLTSFLRYYTLKNLAAWLAKSILAHGSKIRILPHKGFMVKYKHNIIFHFRLFPKALMSQFFERCKNFRFQVSGRRTEGFFRLGPGVQYEKNKLNTLFVNRRVLFW